MKTEAYKKEAIRNEDPGHSRYRREDPLGLL